MGYYSRLSQDSAWVIDPPLPWVAFRDKIEVRDPMVKWEIREVEVNTDESVVITRTAVGVVPDFDDECSMYDLRDELGQYARVIGDAGSAVTGWIVRTGEEQGDVERYTVGFGRLVTEEAELRWPDGTIVTEARL